LLSDPKGVFHLKNLTIALLWTSLCVAPLMAQPHVAAQPGAVSSEVRLQFVSFDNLFDVAAPAPAQTINGWQAEYRGAFGLKTQKTTEAYWHLNFLDYVNGGLASSYGGRLGLTHTGPRNDYNVYFDLGKNRPASDIRNGGTADRATFYGEYGFRPSKEWRISFDGLHDIERIRKSSNLDNHLDQGDLTVHYEGFGYRVIPEIGAGAGRRSVNDRTASYQNRDLFAGVEIIPVDPLYLSLGYRVQRRNYDAASFNPDEDHGIWEIVGDWHVARPVHLTAYYQSEDVSSSLPSNRYRTGIFFIGTSYSF
jgi:hypothetical protein